MKKFGPALAIYRDMLGGGRYVQDMHHILVCDDDLAARDAIVALLRNSGYAVSTAAGHADMLNRLEHTRPDLIILDVRMPERDGIWIAENMRALGMDIPIIFYTGCDSFVYRLYAPFVGAEAYLTKPCDPSILLKKIQKVLHAHAAA